VKDIPFSACESGSVRPLFFLSMPGQRMFSRSEREVARSDGPHLGVCRIMGQSPLFCLFGGGKALFGEILLLLLGY
jgi:hypothetical protein